MSQERMFHVGKMRDQTAITALETYQIKEAETMVKQIGFQTSLAINLNLLAEEEMKFSNSHWVISTSS